jgi:hypothetical protein
MLFLFVVTLSPTHRHPHTQVDQARLENDLIPESQYKNAGFIESFLKYLREVHKTGGANALGLMVNVPGEDVTLNAFTGDRTKSEFAISPIYRCANVRSVVAYIDHLSSNGKTNGLAYG